MSMTCLTGKGTSNKFAQGHGRWEPKEPLQIATKEVAQKGAGGVPVGGGCCNKSVYSFFRLVKTV